MKNTNGYFIIHCPYDTIKSKLYLLKDLLKIPSYTPQTLLNVWSTLYITHLIK